MLCVCANLKFKALLKRIHGAFYKYKIKLINLTHMRKIPLQCVLLLILLTAKIAHAQTSPDFATLSTIKINCI